MRANSVKIVNMWIKIPEWWVSHPWCCITSFLQWYEDTWVHLWILHVRTSSRFVSRISNSDLIADDDVVVMEDFVYSPMFSRPAPEPSRNHRWPCDWSYRMRHQPAGSPHWMMGWVQCWLDRNINKLQIRKTGEMLLTSKVCIQKEHENIKKQTFMNGSFSNNTVLWKSQSKCSG